MARLHLPLRCTALLVGMALVGLACLAKFLLESSVLLEVLGQRQPEGRSSSGGAATSALGAAAAGSSSEFARRVSLLGATSAAAFREVAALQDWSAKAFGPRHSTSGGRALCPQSSNRSSSNCIGTRPRAPARAQSQVASQSGASDGAQSHSPSLPGSSPGPSAESQGGGGRLPSGGPRRGLPGTGEAASEGHGGGTSDHNMRGKEEEATKTAGAADKGLVLSGGGEGAAEVAGGTPLAPADLICRDEAPHSRNFRKGGQKYLVVGRINEQLSKARKHLAELVTLALLANRTLVLPHCGNSRVGPLSDYKFPLCTYFDLATLPLALRWVSESYFQAQLWPHIQRARRRGGKREGGPVAAFLMTKPGAECSYRTAMKTVGVGLHHLGSQDNPGAYQGLIPISFTRTDAPDIPTVCMSECPLRPRQRVCGDKLVMQSAALRDSEVLLAVKGTPFSCLAKKAGKMAAKVLFNLQYAPRLVALIDSVVRTHLGGAPFVALQWRTERAVRGYVKPKVLQYCAARAVAAVKALQRDMGRARGGGGGGGGGNGSTPRFFFATDVTHDRKVLSTSWYGIKKSAMTFGWQAAGVIREKLKPFSVSTLVPAAGKVDLGIQGILDKLLCAEAPVLLTAPEECKGRHGYKDKFGSSFAEEICGLRVKLKQKPCQVW